jgi:hypothetical protein
MRFLLNCVFHLQEFESQGHAGIREGTSHCCFWRCRGQSGSFYFYLSSCLLRSVFVFGLVVLSFVPGAPGGASFVSGISIPGRYYSRL